LNPLHFLGEVKYYVLRNTTQNIIMTGFALKRRKVLNRGTAVPLEPPAFPG